MGTSTPCEAKAPAEGNGMLSSIASIDFERSAALIKILIEKAKRSSVQLIMTTNDRFVMNNVDLEYWCVVERLQRGCKIHNYRNSKEAFDEFELTGLSNFDFFAGDFLEAHGAKR